MAERYQDRPFPADDEYDRGHASPKADTDPLAELARLIGQTDPFANFGRGNATARGAAGARPASPSQPADADEDIELGPPPSWMQHRPEPEPELRPEPPAALRYAAAPLADEPSYHEPSYHETPRHESVEAPLQADPARYDDALYGQLDPAHGASDALHDGAYPDQPYYTDPDGYGEESGAALKPRRNGMLTVVAVLTLAVVGTGAAFGYRTYVGSTRSGEAPVIKADTGPTKVLPPGAADGAGKPIQDRLAAATPGAEALVSREEQPVDPAKAGPRVVLPQTNQTPNSPFPPTAPPARPAATAAVPTNGTLAGDEPRKIRTLSVRPDQADLANNPAPKPGPAKPAPARPPAPIANANASTANAPLSLVPQATQPEPRTRVATAPAAAQPASGSGGGAYLVQIASQRSEADAQASFRALQGKYPSVLGSRNATIKRADLGDKGVYYRAMVGPFGSPDEASAFCGNLKTAGGQCVVQRN